MKAQNFVSELKHIFSVLGTARAESISHDIQTLVSNMATGVDSVYVNIAKIDKLLSTCFFELREYQINHHIHQLKNNLCHFVTKFIEKDEAIKIINEVIDKFLIMQRLSNDEWANMNAQYSEPYSLITTNIFEYLIFHEKTSPHYILNKAVLNTLEKICLDYFYNISPYRSVYDEIRNHVFDLLNCRNDFDTEYYTMQDLFQSTLLQALLSEDVINGILQETRQYCMTYLLELNSEYNVVLIQRMLDGNLNRVLEKYFNMKFNEMRDKWIDGHVNGLEEMMPWGGIRHRVAEIFIGEAGSIQQKVSNMILAGSIDAHHEVNQLLLTEEGRQHFLSEVKVNPFPSYSAAMLRQIHALIVLHQFQWMLEDDFKDLNFGENLHYAMIYLRTIFNQLPGEIVLFCHEGIANQEALEQLIIKYSDDLHVLCRINQECLDEVIKYVAAYQDDQRIFNEIKKRKELACLAVKPENLALSKSLSLAVSVNNLKMFSLFLPKASLASLKSVLSQVKNTESPLMEEMNKRLNEFRLIAEKEI